MQTGAAISGVLHLGLIGWVVLGGVFKTEPLPLEVADVAIISSAEFAALTASPVAPDPVATPAALSAPNPEDADSGIDPLPVDETPPERPTADRPPEPETTEPQTPAIPDPPAAPPADLVETAPEIAPPPDESTAALTPPDAQRPRPRPVDRIAPRPSEPPPPDARPDPVEAAPEAPDGTETDVAEGEDATAPEEAVTEIPIDPAEGALAPVASMRPPSRPTRPTPAAQSASRDDAVEDAVETALQSNPETSTAATDAPGSSGRAAPSGPPLTTGERDALRVAVSQCWNVGSLSSAALDTTVVVAVSMTQDGRPVTSSIRLASFTGGNEAAAQQAFAAARRAILRCGQSGFGLPDEKYDHWREIEMTFNPEKMRSR